MTQSRKSPTERFAEALGASRVVPLQGVSAEGPLGLLWLRAAVARGAWRGGPESAAATAEQVRASHPEQWREIEHLAAELSRHAPPLDPLELAARLIEHNLLELHHQEGAESSARRADARASSPVFLDSFYEELDSPADCLEAVEP